MMGDGFGRSIAEAMAIGFFLVIVVAFGLGLLVAWGLPKLWELIKPLIHAMTA